MLIISISGVSGAGKTTLQKELIKYCKAGRVISNTTRPKRVTDTPHEYRYFSRDEFLATPDWLWTQEIHGNLYGTRKADIDAVLNEKGVAILAVVHYCHGILVKIYENTPVKLLALHLMSPSESEVRQRLVGRGDLSQDIEKRILDTRDWDTQAKELGFVHLVQPGSQEQVFQQCVNLLPEH